MRKELLLLIHVIFGNSVKTAKPECCVELEQALLWALTLQERPFVVGLHGNGKWKGLQAVVDGENSLNTLNKQKTADVIVIVWSESSEDELPKSIWV